MTSYSLHNFNYFLRSNLNGFDLSSLHVLVNRNKAHTA